MFLGGMFGLMAKIPNGMQSLCRRAALNSSFLLMHILGNRGDDSSGWVPVTHIGRLEPWIESLTPGVILPCPGFAFEE